jgi:hypothetical protein
VGLHNIFNDVHVLECSGAAGALRWIGPRVEGEPPSPVLPPAGCRFNPRCPAADDRCRSEEPQLREIGVGHFVACHHPLVGGDAPVSVRSATSA